MRLLHITRERDNDPRYGIRKSLLPVISHIQNHGHYVEIFDWNKSCEISPSKIEFFLENIYLQYIEVRFGESNRLTSVLIKERVSIARKAAKYAAKENITHVHCHDPLLGYYYCIFSKIYNSTKCWGYTLHSFGRFVKLYIGIEIAEHSLKFLQKLEQKASRTAAWIIYPSKSGLSKTAEELHIEFIPEKWYVIPHSVDVNLTNKNEARQKLGIKDNEKLLLAVGQLNPMKRISLLLEAVSLIPINMQPYTIILGEGSEYKNLLNLAEKLNIKDKIKIKVTDNIGEYLSAADVYVSTSSIESFGLANCEAILAGVPSICTNVGAVSELLEDAAILVGDDKKEIAEKIVDVLYSNDLRLQLQKRAKIVSSKWPDAETIAIKMEEIYHTHNYRNIDR